MESALPPTPTCRSSPAQLVIYPRHNLPAVMINTITADSLRPPRSQPWPARSPRSLAKVLPFPQFYRSGCANQWWQKQTKWASVLANCDVSCASRQTLQLHRSQSRMLHLLNWNWPPWRQTWPAVRGQSLLTCQWNCACSCASVLLFFHCCTLRVSGWRGGTNYASNIASGCLAAIYQKAFSDRH